MADQFANNAASTLASGITNSATSLTVATGEGALFPQPGDGFWATLEEGTTREIVRVTARSTDTFTVTRGQQGTSGFAFSTGAKVELRWTTFDAQGALNGSFRLPTFRSGKYYQGPVGIITATPYASGEFLLVPFFVPQRVSVDRIGIEVTTAAGTAGSVARLGIYRDLLGWPGTVLLEAGTILVDSTGGKEITISQVLDPDLYWLALLNEHAGTNPQFRSGMNLAAFMYSNSLTNSGVYIALQKTGQATGSLPANPTGIGPYDRAPLVRVRTV